MHKHTNFAFFFENCFHVIIILINIVISISSLNKVRVWVLYKQ